ncbi:putative bifunctional diguanylate cyclase/phosphodiesterase [Stappia indica]|uniref:putative bifunctional diguanylate cyclase/phosphodiesterase n=1 Tax=Stappia indica TaxID=538381 RepID=UPI001CD542D0|nr:bifunctional diguanylate cyclase/phosphodiesterase [Stappia indica]MCA1300024.1 bifunctional diguanylate cyclase/phosphodiesterase [Stappia indica]
MTPKFSNDGTRLANTILFPVVGLVLVAIAFSVTLIIYTSRSADIAAMHSERDLLRGSTRLQLQMMAKEQEGVAVWDQAFVHSRPESLDTSWLDVNIGRWLFQNHGHERSLVIDEDRSVIYSAANGLWSRPADTAELVDQIWPLITRTRARFINGYTRLSSGMSVLERPAAGFTRSIHEMGFVALDDRPAFVSVTAIAPEVKRFVATRRPPAVLVSIKKLDANRLEALARMSGIDRLQVASPAASSSAPISDETGAYLLKNPRGQIAGRLIWRSATPGSAILSGVGPVLLLLAAAIATLTGLVLFYIRQTTRRLARSEASAQHAAMHDSLTGLANRDFFAARFRAELAEWQKTHGAIGVIYVDLDHFKDINDTLGHAAGDEVIREAARRLRILVPDNATIARISGDEFALLLPGCPGRTALEAVLKRMQSRFAVPMYIGGSHLYISLSAGAAIAPEDSLSMGELLRKADIALYAAKADGRGRWAFFEQSMEEQVRTRENLAHALRRAIDDERLHVLYQPQTTIDGRTVLSVEALLRWTDPEMGAISPSVFVPIAEETGLINDLGLYVLRQACTDARAWPHLGLAVNVSPTQFRHPRFIDDLRETLEQAGFDPARLEIEVTETVFATSSPEVMETLTRVQEMGVRVALDDFGVGYSSLSYLRRFPFNTLKIDRSFIADLEIGAHAHSILSTIIDLGEALGMKVVAEGIETAQQVAILQRTNCDKLQGFFMSRPVPPEQIRGVEDRLAAGQPVAAAGAALTISA